MADRPVAVPNDLICQAHLNTRPEGRRIAAHRRLSAKIANQFSRSRVEQKVLDDLAIAAYPGQFGALASYENARHELLASVAHEGTTNAAELLRVLDLAFAAGVLHGQRDAIRATAPCIWRAATEADL